MKIVYVTIWCLLSQYCIAQKILVPYRSGKLFGLSDEKGKPVLTPAYDHIEWMNGTWFSTMNQIELKDTLETAPGKFYIRNTKTTITGLVNNGKVVLADEPFERYEIVADKCIVATFEKRGTNLTKEQYKKYGDKRKQFSLFNLQGKNLYPENFRRIQKMDTAGESSIHKNTARYILFMTTSFNNRYSLLVVDADRQEIAEWPVKDAYKLQPEQGKIGQHQIIFSITDSNMVSTIQMLDYSTGKFLLGPVPGKVTLKSRERREDDNIAVQEVSIGNGTGMGTAGSPGMDVAVPNEERVTRRTPAFNPYYIFVKDSLFYLTSYQDRRAVTMGTGTKVILTEPLGMTQYQPVMVRQGDRFYIVKDGQVGTVAYDSLIYFGSYFLAWKKIKGQTKAGVINASDSIVVPFRYDSLYAGIRYVEVKDQNPAANKPNYKIIFKEADSKYDYTKLNPYKRSQESLLTVFVNDRAGVISMKGDTVIPFQYQMIARNSIGHMKPKEDEFIVLKQNGRYGLTNLKYNKEKKHNEMSSASIAPVFEYLPGFYYPNYFGIKNFRLIGLYDDQLQFMGYGTPDGKVFYQNK